MSKISLKGLVDEDLADTDTNDDTVIFVYFVFQ